MKSDEKPFFCQINVIFGENDACYDACCARVLQIFLNPRLSLIVSLIIIILITYCNKCLPDITRSYYGDNI